jgi:hypothetical protein
MWSRGFVGGSVARFLGRAPPSLRRRQKPLSDSRRSLAGISAAPTTDARCADPQLVEQTVADRDLGARDTSDADEVPADHFTILVQG